MRLVRGWNGEGWVLHLALHGNLGSLREGAVRFRLSFDRRLERVVL